MFAVKILNNKSNRKDKFLRSIDSILSYLNQSLEQKITVIDDDFCIEMVSGDVKRSSSDKIVTELLIKKTILVDESIFDDKYQLDKYLSEIKHFCKQAKEIENIVYSPLSLRVDIKNQEQNESSRKN